VALSLESPPPGVTRHRVSAEPGLSSPPEGEAAARPSNRAPEVACSRRRVKSALPDGARSGMLRGDPAKDTNERLMTRTAIRQTVWIALGALTLSGCSWFESEKTDPIFADLPTGPPNATLVDSLPNDLPGATEDIRHFRETFAPPELLPAEDRPPGDSGGD